MDQQLVKPKIRDLFVLLKRESLVNLQHKQELKLLNNDKGPRNRLRRKKYVEPKTQHRKIEVTRKDLIVILEECNELKQTEEHLCHENTTPADKNLSSEPVTAKEIEPPSKSAEVKEHDIEINPARNLCVEKVPVYRHVDENVSEKSDMYEFDEIDSSDSGKAVKVTKKKKKKTNAKKYKPTGHVTKKTKICKSYDVAMQDILEKLMKKITNKGKPEIKEKENVFHHSVVELQEVAPHTNFADVVCSNQDDEANKTAVEVNKTYEMNTENNNSQKVDCVCSPTKPKQKIHVISDVTLNKSTDYLFLDESLEPDANSTVLPDNRSKPWRFGVDLKRNPYYLDIKKTALPSLQQDMVIDQVLVKKIEELFAKIPKKSKKSKKSPPAEKLKSKDVVDKENISHVSLFDSDDLFVDEPKPLQENVSPSKNKRNVLGPKIQNEINIMKPVNLPKERVRDIQTYFLRKSPNKSSNSETLKEKVRSPRKDPPDETVDDNSGPKLFEEEESIVNFNETPKIYVPKIHKKRKVRSDSVESNHEKHKRQMTKTEEAELEQWAASFNSMCDDIEKYELEIE